MSDSEQNAWHSLGALAETSSLSARAVWQGSSVAKAIHNRALRDTEWETIAALHGETTKEVSVLTETHIDEIEVWSSVIDELTELNNGR